MKTALAAVVTLGFVTFLSMPASAGTPAPAPAPKATAPVGPGALFVESEEGAASRLVLSGMVRTRLDYTRNYDDFKSSAGRNYRDDVNSRVQLGFLFQLNENVDIFVQPQVDYYWGGRDISRDNNGPDDAIYAAGDDNLRMYQAWVALHPEILGRDSVLKVGRMELGLGNGMVVGDNSRYEGLSFDAVRLDLKLVQDLTTSIFGAKVIENDVAYVNGLSTDISTDDPADLYLWGIYNSYNGLADTTIDVYGLLLQGERGIAGATINNYNGVAVVEQNLVTLGARLAINPIELAPGGAFNFDLSLEAATQLGNNDVAGVHSRITDAYAFEGEVGLTLGTVPMAPRLAIGTALATGDSDPASDRDHTFQPIFEDTTNRLGDADMFSLSNLKCWFLKGSVKPAEKLELGAAYYRFEAMHVETAVGGGNFTQPANGAGAFAAAAGEDNDVADEFDFYADYKLTKNVGLRGVYAMVDPSEFIHDKAGFSNSQADRFFATLVVKW